MNPNRPSGWASDALDLSKSAAAMPTGRSSRTRQMGPKPQTFIAKQASSGHFLKFSCFLDRSGTLIASSLFREAVRIGVALPEKPEPCRFQTSTPTGKGAGLGCNLPGRAPLLPVGVFLLFLADEPDVAWIQYTIPAMVRTSRPRWLDCTSEKTTVSPCKVGGRSGRSK